jgi:AraC family ethanolamine operon transcriptional activator
LVVRTLDATFDNVEAMCESVRAWSLDFQPLSTGRGILDVGRVVQSEAAGALFGHARFRTPLQQAGAPPPGVVTFVIQEPGMRGLWWRGHDVNADTVLAFPIGSELSSVSGSDFDIHTISVSEEALDYVAGLLELELPESNRRAEVFRASETVLNPLRARLRLLRDEGLVARQEDVAELLIALLPGWLLHSRPRLRSRPTPRARSRAIRMSLELMEAKPLAELSADQLRAYAGVSERTLQYAFRDRFGLTPAAFIKARRLAAVSAMLKRTDAEVATVGDIAAQFGFWHSGQFAADYKRAFGELPSDALLRRK